MQRFLTSAILFLVPASNLLSEDPRLLESVLALKALDPVELVAGKEVRGNPEIVVRHGRFRYAFATEANRKQFENDPERYAVQFGGACMRMGPLSGVGSPDRFHVFDGRIYLFASEGCRNGFKADPTRFIDREDEAPLGSADAAKKADNLLRNAVAAVGGERTIRQLSSLQAQYRITAKQGEREIQYKRVAASVFPDRHVSVNDYGDSQSSWRLLGNEGYLNSNKEPVEPSVRRYMIRMLYREPIQILRAWLGGEAKAFHLGSEKIGDVPAERVSIAVHGATTTLLIHSTNGQVLRAAYRSRTASGIVSIEHQYSDFRSKGGLTFPFNVKTSHDGKVIASPTVVLESLHVNERIDPALVRKPE